MTEAMRQPVESALRQILRLVDLGCDLERNMSDADFADDERHEIIPVLDENLFEMFVTPSRFLEASETFYADLWGLDDHERDIGRAYETQAAVLTAEYLLTRRQSGAADATIYMTEFHRWELADRLERLQKDLEAEREFDPKGYSKELDDKFSTLSELLSGSGGRMPKSGGKSDPFLASDLAKLRREASRLSESLKEVSVKRIAAARRTVAILAKSKVAEPLDQLVRIGSPEILDRIVMLQNRFRPVGPELKRIDDEANDWASLIVKELNSPGHRRRYRATRDVGVGKAIWNDARTIAYLRWVVRQKLLPHQRIVFITGDVLLFDTYRRWYFEGREQETRSEPFFFRRVAQYTPLFNPTDTGGDLLLASHRRRSELFSLMRQVIDATLFALPSPEDDTDPDGNEAKSRLSSPESITDPRLESLALKLVDREHLSDDPELTPIVEEMNTKSWISHARTIIQDNRDLWQEIERLSIGASFDLVYGRLSEEQKSVASRYADAGGEETSRILTEYASNVLGRLLQNNFRIWLPLAHSLIEGNLDDPNWRLPQIKRVSVGLRIPLPAEGEGLSSVASRPEIVFARAAMKSLEHQDVVNLARFAGHALHAMEFRDTVGATVDSFEFELKYLNAVAQRLSIASVSAHLRSGEVSHAVRARSGFRGIEQVKTMYGQAGALLHKCIATHYRLADEDADQAVRYIRAVSERASLHLFIATSFGLAAEPHREALRGDAVHYCKLAREDLINCLTLDRKMAIHDPLMDIVRDQFIPNVAGYETLAYLMSEDGSYKMSNWSKATKKKVMAFWKEEPQAHPLLAAELHAFALLSGLKRPPGRGVHKANFRPNLFRLRLPLDRQLYRQIFAELLNDYL